MMQTLSICNALRIGDNIIQVTVYSVRLISGNFLFLFYQYLKSRFRIFIPNCKISNVAFFFFVHLIMQ
jgi:hypothetical protein